MEGGLYELDAADSPVVAEDMSDAEAAWAVGLAKPAYHVDIRQRDIASIQSIILHITCDDVR